MPYRDKERVRQYQREWVRQKRAQGSTENVVNPDPSIKARLEGLTLEGNRIVSVAKEVKLPLECVKVPLYDPAIHRAGDRVLVRPQYSKKLVETVIPEIDAEGYPIPEY